MPTLSVFLRKGNYEALRKAEEKTGRTVGNLLNKLVRHYLEDLVAKEEKGALRSPLRRMHACTGRVNQPSVHHRFAITLF